MAVKNIRQRVVAFVAGILLGPAIVWAGLETGTYISDLVATNPLSSDLASTADDHIRLLKSTIKTTFPNINGAVTATDEQLNPGGLGANPSGTIGLTAVNGSATTYLRSDGAPALSQAIAPTWTAQHIFSLVGSGTDFPLSLRSNLPGISLRESDGAANNQDYLFYASGEQLCFAMSNSTGTNSCWMTVDRTANTTDQVALPVDGSAPDSDFYFGANMAGTLSNQLATFRSALANKTALSAVNQTASAATLRVHNQDSAGDSIFISFLTENTLLGTSRGSIDFNRAGSAVRYNTTSDQRLKKNIRPAGSARDFINSIPVDEFDWRESGAHVPHGFVAQRLNKVAPDCVSSSKDPAKIWAVEKACLVPALVKVIQEQDARIQRLEADAKSRH
jgi:hypothetical protein